jgi:hypothetical protein
MTMGDIGTDIHIKKALRNDGSNTERSFFSCQFALDGFDICCFLAFFALSNVEAYALAFI